MNRQQVLSTLGQLLLTVVVSAATTLCIMYSPLATHGSGVLTAAPIFLVLISPQELGLAYFFFDDLTYEVLSTLDATQGLTGSRALSCVIFNPGADIDFTTTTDLEDVAAPTADMVEFTDHERALVSDSMSSVVF